MLYKVFLVEDEIITREGIRDSVDWAGAGFCFCGEAPDGELALPLIEAESPDILITDIKMPFMDGLELCRFVRQRLPQTRIVILSGHDEFRYAQEAIQLGVTEYLLKPVSVQDLLVALRKVHAQLERERNEQERLRSLRDQLRDNVGLVRQRFLLDLVTGRLSASQALDEASKAQVDLVAQCYLAIVVRFDANTGVTHPANFEAYYRFRQRIAGVFEVRDDLLLFTKDVEETVLILKGDSPQDLQRMAQSIHDSLHTHFDREEGMRLSVGMGRPVQRVGEIPQSFLDAVEESKTQSKAQIGKPAHFNHSVPYLSTALLHTDPAAVSTFLRRGDVAALYRFLDGYLRPVHDDADFRLAANYLVTDVLVAIANFVHEMGGAPEEVIPKPDELEHLASLLDSTAALRSLLATLLTRAIEYRNLRADHAKRIAEQAKGYIEDHFTSDDISLNTVAAAVGLSPNYLSVVFGRETGETFIEYLTRIRVQKAMELLRMTSLSASEIAYRVGYRNPRYFFTVFKKVTGQSPTEFKQETS
jgi:two-component system response regulator YesN